MRVQIVTCPRCNAAKAYVLDDEVDIGVGVQHHIYGYDCPACGQIGLCDHCGAIDGEPHAAWCVDSKGN